MNGVEPKPHESGKGHSYWSHPDAGWNDAIEVLDCAEDGWGVWFWHVVPSNGVERNGKFYDWSERIYFPTREEAEHYAQLVWDMKLYD